MFLGFLWLSTAAMAGPFVATDLTERYLTSPETVTAWLPVLASSAHGHLALFGVIHVLFGLSCPYSALAPRLKRAQTVGLCLGALAMGPLMLARALQAVPTGHDGLGIAVGVCLSMAMIALISHAGGLLLKIGWRG